MKLTAREIEWLDYAVAHMLDDSEPEDQTCAEVLKELMLRYNIESVSSWWFDDQPCTDLQDANDQMVYMREDWQKMAEALGFRGFTDPEAMIERARILRNMLPALQQGKEMNTQDKLAEALRSLRLKFTSGNDVPVPEARITRAEWEAIKQAHAVEAAQAQAQSDDMVTFVHRVLEHFPLDAEGCFLPLSAHRLAFAIEKSRAAAPQQAAEPVAEVSEGIRVDGGMMHVGALAWLSPYPCKKTLAPGTKLYTHPQPEKDAKPNELVQFFRHEGHYMGHQGDQEGWTPEHTAVLAMRKLRLYEKYPVLSEMPRKATRIEE